MPFALSQFDNRSFLIAATTEAIIVQRVQGVIRDVLATGKRVSNAPEDIRAILQAAGCEKSDPAYCEMVFRTNMMSSYSAAHEEEYADPDVAASFPVWRYDGILDGREGDDHRPHFGKYYPASVRFEIIRGKRIFSCRCVPTRIFHLEWIRLKAAGARLADGYVESHIGRPRLSTPLTPPLRQALPPTLNHAATLQDLAQSDNGRQWLSANKAEVRRELLGEKKETIPMAKPVLKKTLPIPEPKAAGRSPADLAKIVVQAIQNASPNNYAPMVQLRTQLSALGITDYAAQDAAIKAARDAGIVTASGIEGRFGITEAELAALYREQGERIGYLSVRQT